MARFLQTPAVIPITPFDPSQDYTVSFLYSDNQIVKNRAIVTNNSTNTVEYDSTVTSMRLQHIIPANSLKSGNQYLIQIQVFDAYGNMSNLSQSLLFYCYSTPSFGFTNISDNISYKNASINLILNYSQSENEPIKNFEFFKYSYNKTMLENSPVLYTESNMAYSFYGLENNTYYYFRAIGETLHGIPLDTGYIKVNVSFNTIPANIFFQVENNYKGGYISLKLNIKNIGYELKNDNYELKDGMLILRDNTLTYNDGFTIDDDFSLFVEAKNLPLKTFLTTNNNTFSLSIIDVCGMYYCRLSVKDSSFKQYVALPKAKLVTDDGKLLITDNGKLIEIVDTSTGENSLVVFEVKRKNGYYGLRAYFESEELN